MIINMMMPVEIPDDYDRAQYEDMGLKVLKVLKCNTLTTIRDGLKTVSEISEDERDLMLNRKSNFFVRDKSIPEAKRMFDSWYDTSNGERIDSMDKIKELEKKGQVFCTPEEAQSEAKKNRKYIDEKYKREEGKRFDERMMPVLKRQGLI
jgi:hypothetical protein